MTRQQANEYLGRIGYSGKLIPGPATLKELQKQHLLHVPFENLDIHIGREIVLDPDRLFTKVVAGKRGGFCYELNLLFNELLSFAGFETRLVSARVTNGSGGFGEEFDHMAVIVSMNGNEFLSDVGFGEFTFAPLIILTGEKQIDERGEFVIANYDEEHLIVRKKKVDSYEDQYIFSLTGRSPQEFEGMCRYHQTSPESHFTKKRLCSLPFDGGRITLTGDSLKLTKGNETTETPIDRDEEFNLLLKEKFGIIL